MSEDRVVFDYEAVPVSVLCRPSEAQRYIVNGLAQEPILEWIRATRSFYEVDLLEEVARLSWGRRAVVVDVGANIGNHTLYFAGALGARVIAVEPNSRALRFLRMNLVANSIQDRVVVCTVAAGRPGVSEATLEEIDPLLLARAKVVEGIATGTRVEVRTLDELMSGLARTISIESVDVVKIDVEGLELDVLAGAESVLARYRPLLVIELPTWERFSHAVRILRPLGYRPGRAFCATPTYVFAQPGQRRRPGTVPYRIWRTASRGRLRATWRGLTTRGRVAMARIPGDEMGCWPGHRSEA